MKLRWWRCFCDEIIRTQPLTNNQISMKGYKLWMSLLIKDADQHLLGKWSSNFFYEFAKLRISRDFAPDVPLCLARLRVLRASVLCAPSPKAQRHVKYESVEDM